MSVFRKIFRSNSGSAKNKTDDKEQSTFIETNTLPIEESFTINFHKNGGKFLYCENNDEVQVFLDKIIEENNWDKKIIVPLQYQILDHQMVLLVLLVLLAKKVKKVECLKNKNNYSKICLIF